MINKCITNSFGNSISFNPEKDDLTMRNYLALAKCIVGVENIDGKRRYPGVSTSCRSYKLYEVNVDKRKPVPGGRAITATNVKTGEIIEFKNAEEAAEFLDYKICTLRTYVCKEKLANKIWKLTYK